MVAIGANVIQLREFVNDNQEKIKSMNQRLVYKRIEASTLLPDGAPKLTDPLSLPSSIQRNEKVWSFPKAARPLLSRILVLVL